MSTTFLLGFRKKKRVILLFSVLKIIFEDTMIFKTKIFVKTKHLKKRSNFTKLDELNHPAMQYN
jgi:hypothetical protein